MLLIRTSTFPGIIIFLIQCVKHINVKLNMINANLVSSIYGSFVDTFINTTNTFIHMFDESAVKANRTLIKNDPFKLALHNYSANI